MLLSFHVAAGAFALGLGAVAILVKKGSWLHRRSGLLFVYAMVVMGGSGAVLAFLKRPTDANVFGGLMAAYFAITALTAVRPASPWTRGLTMAGMVLATGLAVLDIATGITAFRHPRGTLNGVPYPMYFFLAIVLGLAAAGDLRVLRSGAGGAARLARHLWRMCFALFIAAGSFFSIRERVAAILPEPLTALPLRLLAMLLPFAAMFYWLWRLRRHRPSDPRATQT
jgi:hypothetical protein